MRKSPNPICAIPDCSRPTKARNYCALHYRRLRTNGDPLKVLSAHEVRQYVRRPESERFWEKVEKTATCWLWTGAISGRTGYGSFCLSPAFVGDRRLIGAHRWAYENTVGPVPKGLVLDHLCCVRRCVNPDHLEPVTYRENFLRGVQSSTRGAS